MKKMFFALMVMLTSTMAASAMSYEQARNEALFLTDKMAYELNLTDEQYEAAYEINLDYLMGVAGRDDVFGTYWERRNLDLSYILFDWQWEEVVHCSQLLLPSTLLGGWLLALWNLSSLSASRFLLLWSSALLCNLSWWTCLAHSWHSWLLLWTQRALPSYSQRALRNARSLESWRLPQPSSQFNPCNWSSR